MTTALITGASAGIGAAFAQKLAERQTNLILVARTDAKLQQLAQELQEQYKIRVDFLVQDLTAPAAAKTVFDAVTQKGLTIDLLINNAGFGDYGDFAELDGEKQVGIVQLNILALVDLTHQFLPGMRQRRSGGIINMSSTAAFQPMPYFAVYAASKAFVLSFSEALWAENSSYGVRVLAVCPGPTETKFFQDAEFPSFLADVAAANYTPTEVVVRERGVIRARGGVLCLLHQRSSRRQVAGELRDVRIGDLTDGVGALAHRPTLRTSPPRRLVVYVPDTPTQSPIYDKSTGREMFAEAQVAASRVFSASTSNVAAGHCGSMPRSASSSRCCTARRAYHLRSAGTTYHGA